jgi:hypothetical protein
VESGISEPSDILSPMEILNRLNDIINEFIEKVGGPEKFIELTEQILNDNVSYLSYFLKTLEPEINEF